MWTPPGLGHEALMLDTPAAGDSVQVMALTDQGWYGPAFPGHMQASPELRLGFWLYLSSASTSTASPVLQAYLGRYGTGAGYGYDIVTFDPIANGYDQRDTWMYVDTTDPQARWSLRYWDGLSPSQEMTWAQVIDHTRGTQEWQTWAGFEYGFAFLQRTAGTFSAIDGVSAAMSDWSAVNDFELGPTSGRPVLDDCKNDGWRLDHPAGTYKNQGACIADAVSQD